MKKLLALILLALVLVAACATTRTSSEAAIEVEAGNDEEGLARLEQEVKENPNDVELRNYYLRHKAVAVQRYLALGDNAPRAPARSTAPPRPIARALRLDPQNARAKAGVDAAARRTASTGRARRGRRRR